MEFHNECRCTEVFSGKATAESLALVIARLICELRTLKEANPSFKLSYWQSSPGSILNAYREGDLSFEEAVEKIQGLQPEMPT